MFGGLTPEACVGSGGNSMEVTRPHVVVIEPNLNQRFLYEWELEDEGYEVECLPDGDLAFSSVGERTTSLVLTDGGSWPSVAKETTNRLRELFPNAAIIVHTSSVLFPRREEGVDADAVLVKSSDLTQLKQTIRALLADPARKQRNRLRPDVSVN